MESNNEVLEMKFDPNVISHLGIQMYSTLPPVLAELISNAYDAEAENVNIFLNDSNEKSIIVEDDGHGMDLAEINEKFLKIGRDRRVSDGSSKSKNGKRDVIGRKGIGKLAFFGIARNIIIETTANGIKNKFELDWDELKKQGESTGKYEPSLLEKNVHNKDNEHGTKIILSKIKRKSNFAPEQIAYSLSKYFQIFDESDFNVRIFYNGTEIEDSPLTNELRYKNIDQFYIWEFPESNSFIKSNYSYRVQITGKLIASKENTIPEKMKGIALFSRGKLVNDYAFYDLKASSHGYSYITGWLNIDFIEDFDEDVISTNRQSLNWELEETSELKKYLQDIIKAFYNKQRIEKENDKKNTLKTSYNIDIDEWLNKLPKHEKNLAKKISDSILRAEGIETSKAVELIKYTRDSFQFEAFKELAAEIDETGFEEPEKIVDLFKEWKIIEAREMYKIAQVRLETIEKFKNHIESNSREVPELHNFLKQFPWILDPRIMNFEDEVTYSKLLKEKFPESKVPEENKRIDFLCVNFSESYFIIELKRPETVIGKNQLDQALEYVSFIEQRLGNEYGKNVYCYIIGNKLADTPITRKKAEALRNNNDVYFKSYHELLANAKKYHQEFIDKYDEVNND